MTGITVVTNADDRFNDLVFKGIVNDFSDNMFVRYCNSYTIFISQDRSPQLDLLYNPIDSSHPDGVAHDKWAGNYYDQAGAQSKAIVILFPTQNVLSEFRKSKGWEVGVDGSVALIQWGVSEDINTIDIRDPVVGFVFDNKGLMFNITFEGTKFTRLSN